MSRAKRDQIHAHPADAVDVAGALVACVKSGRTITIIYVPDIKKPVVGVPQTGEVLRVWAEGNTFYAKGVVAQGGEGDVWRGFFGSRKDENAWFVAGLLISHISFTLFTYMHKQIASQLTSPIARYFPSGLKLTHVALLTLSFAAQLFPPAPPGLSNSPAVGVPSGLPGVSLGEKTAVRLLRSEPPVGVLGS
jgi:hypothetical protein